MSHLALTRFPVYVWPDGSEVELRIRAPGAVVSGGVPPHDSNLLMVKFPDETRLALRLKLGSESNWPAREWKYFIKKSWVGSDFSGADVPENRKKLLGFLYDLKLPMIGSSQYLVMNQNELDWIDFMGPTFIPDQTFEQRYEEARKGGRWKKIYAPFLPGSKIKELHNGLWSATFPSLSEIRIREYRSTTLEEAVDWLLKETLVFPESQRSAWEAANVERGTWLLPTAEEIEIFHLLDEPLPFTWGYEELERWLMNRV